MKSKKERIVAFRATQSFYQLLRRRARGRMVSVGTMIRQILSESLKEATK